MLITAAIIDALADEPSVAFVLDRSLQIAHVNPAWAVLARRDGALPVEAAALVGRAYLDFVHGPQRALLEGELRQALLSPAAPVARLLRSECNTPSLVRILTTHVMSIVGDTATQNVSGLVLLHSLEVECLLVDREQVVDDGADGYRDQDGTLLQCGNCRRARDVRDGKWKMNAALFRPLHDVSHGLCQQCLELYYPA